MRPELRRLQVEQLFLHLRYFTLYLEILARLGDGRRLLNNSDAR